MTIGLLGTFLSSAPKLECSASCFAPAACSSATSSATPSGKNTRSPSSSPLSSSPLSSSPPSVSSMLHLPGLPNRRRAVATQATKEFVGSVVRSRSKRRGRKANGGDDEDDYFEDDGVFGGGGFDGINWGGGDDGGASGGGGGFNWRGSNWSGGEGEGSYKGGYSENNALFCAAMYNTLWFWQLACLGSCAQAARFLVLCAAASRTEQATGAPGAE